MMVFLRCSSGFCFYQGWMILQRGDLMLEFFAHPKRI